MINLDLWTKYKILREAVYKKYSKFHHAEYLNGPRVLVLSPHPDDDVFACGGTLIKHLRQGHAVKIVYLCNGGKGISGMSEQHAAAIRRQEAIAATSVLGIAEENLYFMDEPDGRLHIAKQALGCLQSIIGDFHPDLIYLPSFIDNHPDHVSTNRILKAINPGNTFIAAYELWTPIVPNLLVDISNEIEQKMKAMKAHKSQLAELNYLDAITGLNRYRGSMYTKKKMTGAEAFCFAPPREYFSLFD